MKKQLYAIFALVLLAAAFSLGSWYNQQKTVNTSRPAGELASVKTSVESELEFFEEDDPSKPSGTVKINSQKRQLVGVRVEKVEKTSQKYALRTLGKVAADENRTYRVLSSAEGWVSDIRESTTGSLVKKDQLMATVYNYQFLTRQQQYFYALEFEERKKARAQASNLQTQGPQSPAEKQQNERQAWTQEQTMPSATFSTVPATPGGETNMSGRVAYSIRDQLEVAKLELYSLGVGDYQIQEITRTKKLASDIEIRSPVTGIVISRNVSPQQRFDRGLELFRIADLSRVWIIADVYGGEEKYIRPGMSAKVSLPGQKESFQARVTDIPPPFDTATRTLKVRLEVDNPDYVLRPEMFVDVEFPLSLPPGITVPTDAVLDSGLKKTVFVDLGEGLFDPREVETGWRFGNRVEIMKGLKPGERIAMSGTFLIDSESRLELAAAGMVGMLSRDPVCGAEVSMSKAEKAGRKSRYRERTYYFTSDECKTRFDKSPERYVKSESR